METPNNLATLFENRCLIIPDYQRGYSWATEQCEDFIDDLYANPDGEKLFFGTAMMQQAPERGVDFYYVVDGQQRLTTALILASRIHRQLTGSSDPSTHELSRRLGRLYLGAANAPRLRYEDATDTQALGWILQAHGVESLRGLRMPNLYCERLREAAVFFATSVIGQDPKRLASLARRLLEDVAIHVRDIDAWEAFVVFECLNNRGKKLSVMELLKNRLLYLSTLLGGQEGVNPATIRTQMKETINRAWKNIYRTLGELNVPDDEPDTEFLRDAWIMENGRKRSKQDAFRTHLLTETFHRRRIGPVRRDWRLAEGDILDSKAIIQVMGTQASSDLRSYMRATLAADFFDNTARVIEQAEGQPDEAPLTKALAADFNAFLQNDDALEPSEHIATDNQKLEQLMAELRRDAKSPETRRRILEVTFPDAIRTTATEQLTADEIVTFCDRLEGAMPCWACQFKPHRTYELFSEPIRRANHEMLKRIVLWLDRLLHLPFPESRPLIMAALIRLTGDPSVDNFQRTEALLAQIERLAFLDSLAHFRSRTGDWIQSKAAMCFSGSMSLEDISRAIDIELVRGSRKVYENLSERVRVKHHEGAGKGWYGLGVACAYLLYEYEYHLVQEANRGNQIVGLLPQRGTVKASIEHVFPQAPRNPDNAHWPGFFPDGNMTNPRSGILTHSLGNLVFVTAEFNRELSNSGFDVKRHAYKHGNGSTQGTVRIAEKQQWTPIDILLRGIDILEFIEIRWAVLLGSRADKAQLLQLDWLLCELPEDVRFTVLEGNAARQIDIHEPIVLDGENNMLTGLLQDSQVRTLGELLKQLKATPWHVYSNRNYGVGLAQYERMVMAVLKGNLDELVCEVEPPAPIPPEVPELPGSQDELQLIEDEEQAQQVPPAVQQWREVLFGCGIGETWEIRGSRCLMVHNLAFRASLEALCGRHVRSPRLQLFVNAHGTMNLQFYCNQQSAREIAEDMPDLARALRSFLRARPLPSAIEPHDSSSDGVLVAHVFRNRMPRAGLPPAELTLLMKPCSEVLTVLTAGIQEWLSQRGPFSLLPKQPCN